MSRLARTVAAAAVAALLASPAVARADSDPASDTLLLQDVYLPVEPPLSTPDSRAIRNFAATIRKSGYPLKVAIIATANDLGLVPQLFGKPQQYAAYLGREISFNAKKPLLVVMPGGYGAYQVAPSVARAVSKQKPPGSSLDALAKSTVDTMASMSKAAGHPAKAPSFGGGDSSGTSPAIIFGVPVLLLALAGGLMALKRRSEAGERDAAAP